MPRGKITNKNPKLPDNVYKSKVVTKLINMVMLHGKKTLAESIVYTMMEGLNEDKKTARTMFEDAVKNVMPDVEVRTRRVGGANYQIPVPLKHGRAETLALRWIVDSSRSKKGKAMEERLLDEVKLAYEKEGSAMKKKEETHKMANANRAFAHFRW